MLRRLKDELGLTIVGIPEPVYARDLPSDLLDESFAWDKASNAVPVDRALRVIAGAVEQNQVVQWGGTRYDYDSQGRMVRKSTPSGPVVFAWNDEHQLVASGSVRGGWRYHYDALGRRIAKQWHDGARADAATWFVWDGLRLAQEVVGEHCVITTYEDAGSYVPLAQVEQGIWEKTVRPERIFHFHTDVNGAPEELTSHTGKLVCRARYKTWGNLATEAWERGFFGTIIFSYWSSAWIRLVARTRLPSTKSSSGTLLAIMRAHSSAAQRVSNILVSEIPLRRTLTRN